MKKHILIIITALLLLSSCTHQMTDEEILQRAEEIEAEQADAPTVELTSEPTAEPTAEPEAYERYNTEPFESYYVDVKDYITAENYDYLKHLYDNYGIVMKFDKSFGNYSYKSFIELLPTDKYDLAISAFEKFINIMNPDNSEETTNAIARHLQEVYCVDKNRDAGNSAGREIMIALGSYANQYDEDTLAMRFLSEFSNNLTREWDLETFKSYNDVPDGYPPYRTAGQPDFVDEVLRPLEKTNLEEMASTMFDAGHLNSEGYKNLDDHVAQIIKGVFSNENNFWDVYGWSYFKDDNQTIFNEVNEILKLLGNENSEWSPENIYKNYCPVKIINIKEEDEIVKYDAWEYMSQYFED